MVQTIQPFVYIEPPTVEPLGFGLFSAAQPLTGLDPHWQYGGVEFESLASYGAGFYPVGINAAGGAGGTKNLPNGLGTTKGLPFAVYAGISCGSVGYTDEQANARALRVLELSGQHAAEQALWTGAGGNTPKLNAAGTTTVVGAATELTLALAALEEWLADNYHGRGVIHAKRGIGIRAGGKRLTFRDPLEPGRLRTAVGTVWAFGGGYDGTGPNAAAPAAGTQWIYATGQIGIDRSAPSTPANLGQALNRNNNVVNLIAEQEYLLTIDGAVGAALVDLTK